jgi:hypothetical protein
MQERPCTYYSPLRPAYEERSERNQATHRHVRPNPRLLPASQIPGPGLEVLFPRRR